MYFRRQFRARWPAAKHSGMQPGRTSHRWVVPPAAQRPEACRMSAVLAITAETLMNESLDPILAANSAVLRRVLVSPGAPACPLALASGLDETASAEIVNLDAAETFVPETGTMIVLDRIARTRSHRSGVTRARPALALHAAPPPCERKPLHRTAARAVISDEAAFVRSFPAATVASVCHAVHSRRRSRSPWRLRPWRSPHAGAAVPAAASRPVPR